MSSGGGRLYHEMPVLHVMGGRELADFSDLQKTLAQLGLGSGSTLLRLGFRATDVPLEEAMANISRYFESVGERNESTDHAHGAHSGAAGETGSTTGGGVVEGAVTESVAGEMVPAEPVATAVEKNIAIPENPSAGTSSLPSTADPTPSETPPDGAIVGPDRRLISVFAPPTSNAPQATQIAYNAADYETTIEAARFHQSRLSQSGKNRRLPSDKEIAEQERVVSEKLAGVNEVTIRVRLPDQSLVQGNFTKLDTARSLYAFVRGVLERPEQGFSLRYVGPKGLQVSMVEGKESLIGNLGLQGRVLIILVWDDTVGLEVRSGPPLKKEYRDQAVEIKVENPVVTAAEEQLPGKSIEAVDKGKEKAGGQDKEAKLKRLLGRLSKK